MTIQRRTFTSKSILPADNTGHTPLSELTDPEPWMQDALCAQTDPDSFFPEIGHQDDARAAKRVCLNCEVRPECLAYAFDTDQQYGIWGGQTPRERRKAQRQNGGTK